VAQRQNSWRRRDERVRFSSLLFVVCLLFSGILIYLDRPSSRPGVFADLRAGSNDIAVFVLDMAVHPFRGLANIGSWWRRQSELAEENRALRMQVAEVHAWRATALSLQERNARYREALNLQGATAQKRISAWIVADRSNVFVRSSLIGAGAREGVRTGYPVVSVYGLVGRAVEVGRNSSRILLLTDINSRVAVMADRSNARALLVGDNTDFPRLEYLGDEPDLQEGDRIITSGDDNVMLRGLPVGQAIRDRDGRWRVALFNHTAPIDLVWIWSFEPVADPETDPVPVKFSMTKRAG